MTERKLTKRLADLDREAAETRTDLRAMINQLRAWLAEREEANQ